MSFAIHLWVFPLDTLLHPRLAVTGGFFIALEDLDDSPPSSPSTSWLLARKHLLISRPVAALAFQVSAWIQSVTYQSSVWFSHVSNIFLPIIDLSATQLLSIHIGFSLIPGADACDILEPDFSKCPPHGSHVSVAGGGQYYLLQCLVP